FRIDILRYTNVPAKDGAPPRMTAPDCLPEACVGVNERAGDTHRDGSLVYEVVRDAARFAELEPAWYDAWHRNSAHVFQSYEWISHWWKLQSGEFQLHIALAWRGGEIAAILPFV